MVARKRKTAARTSTGSRKASGKKKPAARQAGRGRTTAKSPAKSPAKPAAKSSARASPRSGSGGAARTTVAQIMSRDVITARPEMSVEVLKETMLREDISRIPVVDDEGNLVGIVSRTDVLAKSGLAEDEREEAEEEATVRVRQRAGRLDTVGIHLEDVPRLAGDIMSKSVLRLHQGATVAQAAELMALQHIHGLPVVDDRRRLVGVVSSVDVCAWVAGLQRG